MPPRQTPLLLGTLDLLILKALSLEPLHGLGVSRRVEQITRGAFVVGPGSLFPALHRLEKERVGTRPQAEKGGQRSIEIRGQLGVNGDEIAPRGERPEFLARGRERGDTGRDRRHGAAVRRQPMASSFFLSCAFGTAPIT